MSDHENIGWSGSRSRSISRERERARSRVRRPPFRASAGGLIINRFELSIAVIAPSMLLLFAPWSEHRCTPIFRPAWMHDRRHRRGHSTCARALYLRTHIYARASMSACVLVLGVRTPTYLSVQFA